MVELYIIRGVPVSGKSTLARNMVTVGMTDIHVEADMFMVDGDGDYLFEPPKLKFCHEQCQMVASDALSHGKSVVVSNTFTRKWEMKPYIDMATLHKCRVTILECQGDYENIHGVPVEKVAQMRERFER